MKLQELDMSEQLSTQHTKGEKEKGAKQVARKRAEGPLKISGARNAWLLGHRREKFRGREAGGQVPEGFSCFQATHLCPA